MCGRLACSLSPENLCKACITITEGSGNGEPQFVENTSAYNLSYNLCPSSVIPVMIDNHNFEAKSVKANYIITPMQWGLLSHGDAKLSKYRTHNARIEKIATSFLFGLELTKNHRCVIICEGYYEWQSTRADKQPYFIFPEKKADSTGGCNQENAGANEANKSVLYLAGLFSENVEGTKKYYCTVITKPADERLSWLHSRMPVILQTPEDIRGWINNRCLSNDDSVDYLTACAEKKHKNDSYILKYHPVSKKFVNNSSCNSEKCIEPVQIKRQATLDGWLNKKGPAAFSKK